MLLPKKGSLAWLMSSYDQHTKPLVSTANWGCSSLRATLITLPKCARRIGSYSSLKNVKGSELHSHNWNSKPSPCWEQRPSNGLGLLVNSTDQGDCMLAGLFEQEFEWKPEWYCPKRPAHLIPLNDMYLKVGRWLKADFQPQWYPLSPPIVHRYERISGQSG